MTLENTLAEKPTATLHTFIVYVEDRPGVLNRIVSLFAGARTTSIR